MIEVWIYNISNFPVSNFIFTAVAVLIGVVSLSWILSDFTKDNIIGFFAFVLTLSIFGAVTKIGEDTRNQLKSNNPKYYVSEKVPVARYSIKENLFETKDGHVIKNAKVITTKTIKSNKLKVELKEYKLRKKWYGMRGVKRTVYRAYVVQPAQKVETVKN